MLIQLFDEIFIKYFCLISVILYIGEAPVDPSIGFLPPNNGTTGQGFVKFLVKSIDMACCITRIDAEATIIFDQNEPIGTPPIFNTVSCLFTCLANFIVTVVIP